jgi:energy-coupling factor transporter ATP-binding protein EcfA2
MSERDRSVVDRILTPARPQQKHGLTVNEGYRFIALGETGSGKTTLMRVVVYATLDEGLAEFALIHDAKGVFPEYRRSLQLPNVDAFIARGGFQRGDIPVVSFRGDVRNDIQISAEDVAGFAKLLLRQGKEEDGRWVPRPLVTVIEELSEASSAGRKHVNAPSVLWLAEQGRKVGGSLVGTTQSPRKTPLDLLGQASSIAFFRLTGADANYLGERLDLDPRLIAAVRGDNNEGLPNFHFALYVKGQPWDGEIYLLDKKTALMFE